MQATRERAREEAVPLPFAEARVRSSARTAFCEVAAKGTLDISLRRSSAGGHAPVRLICSRPVLPCPVRPSGSGPGVLLTLASPPNRSLLYPRFIHFFVFFLSPERTAINRGGDGRKNTAFTGSPPHGARRFPGVSTTPLNSVTTTPRGRYVVIIY